jgi:hypothetical protein
MTRPGQWALAAAALALTGVAGAVGQADRAQQPTVTVYKTPT